MIKKIHKKINKYRLSVDSSYPFLLNRPTQIVEDASILCGIVFINRLVMIHLNNER